MFLKLLSKNEYGSSPLTRGTPINALPFRAYNRFIPAYAGNSVKYGQGYANDPVHPRLRGELSFWFSYS